MTKNKKIALLICSHLLVAILCLGGAALWIEKKAVEIIEESADFYSHTVLVSHYSALVDVQRNNAGPEGYREALLIFSDVLDETKEMDSFMFSEYAYSVDKALTFERLSRVEKELGNIQKSEEYLDLAIEHCEGTGWKSCTKEKLSEISAKLEQNGLFGKKED